MAAALFLAGCAAGGPESGSPADAPALRITGTLGLETGPPPPPGSTAEVTVVDFDAAGAPVIARMSVAVDGGRRMVPFELAVPLTELEPEGRYAVLADVLDARGVRIWTTGMAQLIDPAVREFDIGVMMLRPATGRAE